MQLYRLRDHGAGRCLVKENADMPTPGAGEVVVRVRAASLNFRDLVVLGGGYPRNDTPDVIPLSDGAGEIAAVGDGVGGWRPGDRVVIGFLRDFAGGQVSESALRSSLGGGVDGVLAEYVVMPTRALVRLPDSLDFAAAATLPCAAVTAWKALEVTGVRPGATVLTLGTGGVSIFAIQLARAFGAHVVVTSSSDAKLARARALGADVTINYRDRPDWDVAVREATGGVDAVVETVGSGTLSRSMAAARPGGAIALLGVMVAGAVDMTPAVLGNLGIHGIYVGSSEDLAAVTAAVVANDIAPVIDARFGFDDAPAAYEHLRAQAHVGKVVIDFP